MRIEDGFQQTPPPEHNPFTSDLVLPSLAKRLLPDNIRHEIERDLTRLGGDLMGPIRQMSDKVTNPKFVQYNHWGRRIDSLETSEGWRFMRDTAIKEGYINIPYARKYGEYSRIYGFLKNMIMTGDFHVIMCPLGMTDGTARVIELVGSEAVKRTILPRLISRDPSIAYTSGQWMTERPGGSDVSLTETVATSSSTSSTMGDMYTLDGFKWFSSATEADMAIALARTGSQEQGSRALSLFLVPLRLPEQGGPSSPLENGIEIHRLKNKIGTVGVPTAELSLNHTKAWLLGPLNGGVKAIAPVLNITRIHSAIHSIGNLQRCLAIARSYATVRLVQGGSTLLKDVPLYVSSLAKVSLLYRALTHMTFGTVVLLGKSECGTATKEEEARLRLLTPMAKAFTAQQAPSAMEECMAALGAQGYMEETGIGRLIRDGLVEQIWEGTVNVLSLDLVRATKDKHTISAYITWAKALLRSCPSSLGNGVLNRSLRLLSDMVDKLKIVFKHPMHPLLPRPALNFLANITCALHLVEHAIWSVRSCDSESQIDIEAVRRWVEEGDVLATWNHVERAMSPGQERVADDYSLLYGNTQPQGSVKARM